MLKLISKKGCSPCEFLKQRFERDLDSSQYEIITLDSDQEVFDFLEKYNRRSVPTVITDDGLALNFSEAIKFIKNI